MRLPVLAPGVWMAGQKLLGAWPHLCILEGQCGVHNPARIISAALGREEVAL